MKLNKIRYPINPQSSKNTCTSTRRKNTTARTNTLPVLCQREPSLPQQAPFERLPAYLIWDWICSLCNVKQNSINLALREIPQCKSCFCLSLPDVVFPDQHHEQGPAVHLPVLLNELQGVLGREQWHSQTSPTTQAQPSTTHSTHFRGARALKTPTG